MGKDRFHELITDRSQGIQTGQGILEDHADALTADEAGVTSHGLINP